MRRLLLPAMLPFLAACPPPEENRQTLEQLPKRADYIEYGGIELFVRAGQMGMGSAVLQALFGGSPQLVAIAGVVAHYGECAQRQGLANWSAYTHRDDVATAGVVLVASHRMMNDPRAVLGCAGVFAQSQGLNPCLFRYQYDHGRDDADPKNDDTYYVVIAGSREKFCADFCAVMQGCGSGTAVREVPMAGERARYASYRE